MQALPVDTTELIGYIYYPSQAMMYLVNSINPEGDSNGNIAEDTITFPQSHQNERPKAVLLY